MTNGEELSDMTTSLAHVRDNLMVAIAADRGRSRRRHRVRITGLVLAAILASTTAVAATQGFFTPAPDAVKDRFLELGQGVDPSKAVEIGVIDEHAAYAAPTKNGGFCLYFAPNPRSGPTGGACITEPVEPREIAIAYEIGHDGGFLFGRVGADDAASVEVQWPGDGGTLTTPVVTDGFFLVSIPESVMAVLMEGGSFDDRRLEGLTATATDEGGHVVARSNTPFANSLPPWDLPTGPTSESPPG
jgi:hypothetical protein